MNNQIEIGQYPPPGLHFGPFPTFALASRGIIGSRKFSPFPLAIREGPAAASGIIGT